MKIQFICHAVRWFDKVNGNTYHSVRISNCETGETIAAPFQYGYREGYRDTALRLMLDKKWIPEKYNSKPGFNSTAYLWERENDYPVYWIVIDGKKKDCIADGTI